MNKLTMPYPHARRGMPRSFLSTMICGREVRP
ncbi:hypothetical protein GGE66_003107 [Rhizobium leguminosarum]|uniref:Uncharacterized protein n=1 Tax=Rhizobium leguminosarum TaxID=384 RepID=A0A7W9ZTZ7_RHILE|nr:hypothetical protein [Rhizobium leguminosarum]